MNITEWTFKTWSLDDWRWAVTIQIWAHLDDGRIWGGEYIVDRELLEDGHKDVQAFLAQTIKNLFVDMLRWLEEELEYERNS